MEIMKEPVLLLFRRTVGQNESLSFGCRDDYADHARTRHAERKWTDGLDEFTYTLTFLFDLVADERLPPTLMA